MEPDQPTTLICVTPVKNESWILDRFLQCASLWADHIVVADQGSDDGSREIACRYEKVTLVDNPSREYDEGARQRLLLAEARRLPARGKRIILALDADEMLSANWATSPEWHRLLRARPGTILRFRWVNLGPDLQRAWIPEEDIPFGFVDDGSAHGGEKIHSRRLPTPPRAPSLVLRDIKVLHYQYTNWPRMKSKQRWYQCWERLNHPDKRPVTLYRQYHFMDADLARAEPIQKEWLHGYIRCGIDMTSVEQEPIYPWDEDLVRLFEQQSPEAFRKLNVWDVDWPAVSRAMGHETNGALKDPRSFVEKAVHEWLARTQPRASAFRVRAVQKALQLFGW